MILTPNPRALICANLAVGPTILCGQSYCRRTNPIVRNSTGSYSIYLDEPLPIRNLLQEFVVLASVQGATLTAPGGRTVQAQAFSSAMDQVDVWVRSLVDGSFADDCVASFGIFLLPTVS